MQTAERLLQERPLSEISVDDLARGAGISRPTFYFYFSSKDAVVLSLIDRMVEEASDRDEALQGLAEDALGGWRESIETFYATFGSHRAVIRAAADLSTTNAEARTLWSQIMEGWVTHVTERIEAERERGAAAATMPARELATALVQMNEGVLGAIFVEKTPAVTEDRVIDVLSHIWLSAIYGEPGPR